jgi:hypothetical protein
MVDIPEEEFFEDPIEILEEAKSKMEYSDVEAKIEELCDMTIREFRTMLEKYYNESAGAIIDDGTLIESLLFEVAETICAQNIIDAEEAEKMEKLYPSGKPEKEEESE